MKYLEPTMTIKTFAREKVVTVSGTAYIQGLEDFRAQSGAAVGQVNFTDLLAFNGKNN